MGVLLSSMKTLVAGIKSMFSNKAYFEDESGKRIHVQFNPEKFTITRTAEYGVLPMKEQPYVVFSGEVTPQMQIQFFFDSSGITEISGVASTAEYDVRVFTEQFENLVYVKPNLHKPPYVKFVWGSVTFIGYVKQVSTNYTMFNKNGMPIRATVDAQITGIPEVVRTKIPLESPDRTKTRVVSDGTSVWGLANAEYDDISQWRVIAKANGIMDPFDIPTGTVLKVPAL